MKPGAPSFFFLEAQGSQLTQNQRTDMVRRRYHNQLPVRGGGGAFEAYNSSTCPDMELGSLRSGSELQYPITSKIL